VKCDFDHSSWLTDATLAVCAKYCPLLETVVLNGCPLVTDEGVLALAVSRGATLREVQLAHCQQLGDGAVLAIAAYCPLLERITCPRQTSSAAVVALVTSCPQLTSVCLVHTGVTDSGLAAVAKTHCPMLTELRLGGCGHITTEGICLLMEKCAHLIAIALPVRLRDQQHFLEAKSHRVLTVSFADW
jgi:hypothetical protein